LQPEPTGRAREPLGFAPHIEAFEDDQAFEQDVTDDAEDEEEEDVDDGPEHDVTSAHEISGTTIWRRVGRRVVVVSLVCVVGLSALVALGCSLHLCWLSRLRASACFSTVLYLVCLKP
jgi:hypothetical protein